MRPPAFDREKYRLLPQLGQDPVSRADASPPFHCVETSAKFEGVT
jgi:hypothetical protein